MVDRIVRTSRTRMIALMLLGSVTACVDRSFDEEYTAGGPAQAPAPPEPAVAILELDSEGLRLVAGSSRTVRRIPFGAARDTVIRGVGTALGAPPHETSANPDCALEYASWDDVTVWFLDAHFVGWGASGAGLTTERGIGPGSTRADLEAMPDIRITSSSLGTEFDAGGIAGILDGPESDARIARLWAGRVCLAR